MLDFVDSVVWKNHAEVFLCPDGKLKFPETGTGRMPALYKFEAGERSFIGKTTRGLTDRWSQFRAYHPSVAAPVHSLDAKLVPWLVESIRNEGAEVYWMTAKDGPFTLGNIQIDLNDPIDLKAFADCLVMRERPSENRPSGPQNFSSRGMWQNSPVAGF